MPDSDRNGDRPGLDSTARPAKSPEAEWFASGMAAVLQLIGDGYGSVKQAAARTRRHPKTIARYRRTGPPRAWFDLVELARNYPDVLEFVLRQVSRGDLAADVRSEISALMRAEDLGSSLGHSRAPPGAAGAGHRYTWMTDQGAGEATKKSELRSFISFLMDGPHRHYVLRERMNLAETLIDRSGLGFMLDYWRMMGGGDAPLVEAMNLDPLRRINFLNNITLIDVSAPDPGDYVFTRYAPLTLIYMRPSGTPLRALDNSAYIQSVKVDYELAKRTRRPLAQRISVKSPEGAVCYERLLLPWAGRNGETERLMVGLKLIRSGGNGLHPSLGGRAE